MSVSDFKSLKDFCPSGKGKKLGRAPYDLWPYDPIKWSLDGELYYCCDSDIIDGMKQHTRMFFFSFLWDSLVRVKIGLILLEEWMCIFFLSSLCVFPIMVSHKEILKFSNCNISKKKKRKKVSPLTCSRDV